MVGGVLALHLQLLAALLPGLLPLGPIAGGSGGLVQWRPIRLLPLQYYGGAKVALCSLAAAAKSQSCALINIPGLRCREEKHGDHNYFHHLG